jgi:hypothetical protein
MLKLKDEENINTIKNSTCSIRNSFKKEQDQTYLFANKLK